MSKNKKKKNIDENLLAGKKVLSVVFGEHKLKLVIVAFLVIYSTLTNVGLSLFIRTLIDNYILPMTKMASPSYKGLLNIISKMALMLFTGVLANLLYSRMMVDISEGAVNKIRKNMFDHMESLPVSYFDKKSHGDIMSYYTNDVQTLGQAIANSLPSFLSSIMTITFVIIAMMFQSFVLSLIIFVTMGLMIFVMKTVSKISTNYFVDQQKSLAETNGFVEEMASGMKVVKIFNHEKESIDIFEDINNRLESNTFRANRLSLSLMPIIFGIGNIQYSLFAIIGGLFAINNVAGISVGLVASFLQLSRSLTGPMSQVANQLNQVVLALAGARRIFEFLDEEHEKDGGVVEVVRVEEYEKGKLKQCSKRTGKWAWKDPENNNSLTPLLGEIRFENVNFSYDGKNLILKNINLYAKPGQKIAFVGPTGAGKTTITNLINRFYDIDSGKITYDGIDIKRIKKDSLRKTLGMVLQDTHLFTGTVSENIKFGRDSATETDVVKAAKRVQANTFIENLHHGYFTKISGSEMDLSQGQAQLLSIARAEIYNPPLMILDEATSSIDTRTEKIVQKGMDELMKGRTTFVIAHRISTIMDADVILVLDKGQIVERGNHEDLIKEKGIYYKLYNGGFKENN